MTEHIQPLNGYYRDHHGIIVNVIDYDAAGQRVIYRRDGYEWEYAAPLIVFRARFKRMEK
ncbi:DUF4222 domain-containing protein [Izhakiella australiensis]|uniref:DUF4222 domain-containing protein n=1 Tax=Izhakiella australiensis TaxID=1926881 RepID=A0A1S8YP97_9GAMM|nr:DUF4222 domain-containing protein [Izhakiella australiensis]OON40637.1 DUF4222 domain-containing protein [Izhakiella australiensis]